MAEAKLSITTNDERGQKQHREVFMSYGLLNELIRVIGDPQRASTLELDADLAQFVLTIVLMPRTPTGKPAPEAENFELPGLEVEEAYRIFDWVKAHVLDFFVRRLRSSLQSIGERKELLAEIGSTLGGLSPSASNS